MGQDRAHARRADPWTSHAAAGQIDETVLTKNRRAVLEAVRMWGPLTDAQLVEWYRDEHAAHGWPAQSDSGIRSRRAELVVFGWIKSCGEAKTPSGRWALRWAGK